MVWSALARVGFFSYKFGHFSSLGEYSTTDVSNNKNKKSFFISFQRANRGFNLLNFHQPTFVYGNVP